ncbi:hypothetical protein SAMN05421810_11065 [Amycolatopsis arida]|uniref:DUF485 domain-containing protein n=1 Tax=Amycolatopsis arida TaxID=587909 RepID=A0A1I5ZR40_9PSEU|nr:hypothetical protein [Amycolatopsis arida]TDX89298.1 hypothetical protein CLV69_11065 [Amycolatopsis arida]SFQ58870.1 hypothetical protein SAMN05421810_11065 [Amycolatopsis arida]
MSGHRRVAVTSPQTRLARARRRHRGRWRATTLDPADAARAAALYRAQLRRAVLAVLLLFALVGGLPLVLHLRPELDEVRVLDVPVSWLALVAVPFPAMVALAVWQLRGAERTERAERADRAGGSRDRPKRQDGRAEHTSAGDGTSDTESAP